MPKSPEYQREPVPSPNDDKPAVPPVLRIHDLIGAGWANITATHGATGFSHDVSYITDALGDLLQGAIDLIRGSETVSIRFAQEPGGVRFVWRRSTDSVRFVALWFSDFTLTGMQDELGDLEFDQFVPAEQISRSVYAAALWVLHTYGTDGYLDQWHNAPFPMKQFHALRRELESRRFINRI
jgi:hypothetical protein